MHISSKVHPLDQRPAQQGRCHRSCHSLQDAPCQVMSSDIKCYKYENASLRNNEPASSVPRRNGALHPLYVLHKAQRVCGFDLHTYKLQDSQMNASGWWCVNRVSAAHISANSCADSPRVDYGLHRVLWKYFSPIKPTTALQQYCCPKPSPEKGDSTTLCKSDRGHLTALKKHCPSASWGTRHSCIDGVAVRGADASRTAQAKCFRSLGLDWQSLLST